MAGDSAGKMACLAAESPHSVTTAVAEPDVRAYVLIPTYNNAGTLVDVLERTFGHCDLPVVVVNDGSTDDTANLLSQVVERHPQRLMVLTHPHNRGKAAALMTGFQAGGRRGWTHAITLDSDGQLRPEELPVLLAGAMAHPRSLVVGYRDDTLADYPARSRWGRRVSNALIFLETGQWVGDCQCGYRVYPLALVRLIRCSAGRFGFEVEIITRALWAGCAVTQVLVSCKYFPPGQRVTHFKPGRDSLLAVAMHVRLGLRSMWLWGHPRW